MLNIARSMPSAYRDVSPEDLASRIASAKATLGDQLMILGHHYQMEEVMVFADVAGDSFGLSQKAAQSSAELIVFCGVHFMAESADILTSDDQKVILPDLNAGCSMADMADLDQVERAWRELGEVTDTSRIIPITYMNSSAALKAFVGDHGGAVCTSSNARAVLTWALDSTREGSGDKVLFFPDQHLGRNTGLELGYSADDMAVWDPAAALGGLDRGTIDRSTFLLWRGHCSVHQRFSVEQVAQFREQHPDGVVVVHPECSSEVVAAADASGSTDFIIRYLENVPEGLPVAIGTEVNLVQRLAASHPDRLVLCLEDMVCPCVTMSRIDAAHLCWVLEEAVEGRIRNHITVPKATATSAKVALDRMLAIV
jgi:quinolinate synthase